MKKQIICLGEGNLGRAFKSAKVTTIPKSICNVLKIDEIDNVVKKYKPDIIINCTGVVGTIKCYEDESKAFAVNVSGVSNIVSVCIKHNIKLIHFSSFYTGYFNSYTKTKLIADSIVTSSRISSLIVKLPWLYGYQNKNNFILEAMKNKRARIYRFETGFLALDKDVVEYVLENTKKTGTVLLANRGIVSRETVIDYLGLKFDYIKRGLMMPKQSPFPTVELRAWKSALGEYLDVIRSM